MKDYLRLLDTARKEEIFAYETLKDFLFNKKITYIGDDIENGLPDIFTDDFLIGVEVVTCERRVIHKYTEKNRLPIKFSMKIKSDKIVNRGGQKIRQSEQDEYYQNLRINIAKKLKLLKQGNYSGTKNIFLCILSVYEKKPYIDLNVVAKIYFEETKKLNIKFDMLLFIVNKTLYGINEKNEFAIIEEYNYSKIKVDKIFK